jgi:hypothetical protein
VLLWVALAVAPVFEGPQAVTAASASTGSAARVASFTLSIVPARGRGTRQRVTGLDYVTICGHCLPATFT